MTAAGDPKMDVPAGKRKREALGEVTLVTNNKPTAAPSKVKDLKETFDGVVLKPKPLTTRRTVAVTRQSTKSTAVAINSNVLKEVKEAEVIRVPDEDAMVVDPAPPPQQLPSITVRRSLVAEEKAIAPRRSDTQRRASIRSARQQVAEDDEADRVSKKRRTSSEAPEETLDDDDNGQLCVDEEEAAVKISAEIEAYADEVEADPENSAWDDLDADDAEDPLMVSEYVVEIFQYLKQVEVSTLMYQTRHQD